MARSSSSFRADASKDSGSDSAANSWTASRACSSAPRSVVRDAVVGVTAGQVVDRSRELGEHGGVTVGIEFVQYLDQGRLPIAQFGETCQLFQGLVKFVDRANGDVFELGDLKVHEVQFSCPRLGVTAQRDAFALRVVESAARRHELLDRHVALGVDEPQYFTRDFAGSANRAVRG